MLTKETLEFLAGLVQQVSLPIGSPNAREVTERCFIALDEIGAALAAMTKEADRG